MVTFKEVSYETKEWLMNCPLPCRQSLYDAKMTMYHRNAHASILTQEEEQLYKQGFYFTFGFETFAVEEHVETLIYDSGNFLAQIGGNLGLFLGFSCFSAIIAAIQCLEKLNIFRK